jgi:hypothetical protein
MCDFGNGGGVVMAKVGIVFTDTPDGGFDFDFFMFEGEHS